MISSESIPPSKPKSAPDAPTEILDWIKSDDNILPPKPDTTYSNPILTVGISQSKLEVKRTKERSFFPFKTLHLF